MIRVSFVTDLRAEWIRVRRKFGRDGFDGFDGPRWSSDTEAFTFVPAERSELRPPEVFIGLLEVLRYDWMEPFPYNFELAVEYLIQLLDHELAHAHDPDAGEPTADAFTVAGASARGWAPEWEWAF